MVRNHAEVWHGFTRFMIFGISAVVVLLVGMAAFLL
ncbi:MAG: aa3-type cytochrome c oxidase subunit IV [Azospirillum sp.]|nr:aa3-type cytochrome c oxidase subunit IV [Azospirillum sp.]